MQNPDTLPGHSQAQTRAKAQRDVIRWLTIAQYLTDNDPVIRRAILEWESDRHSGEATSDWPGWARTPLGPFPR